MEQMRKLLETYSGIPSDQQSEHVHKIVSGASVNRSRISLPMPNLSLYTEVSA